MIDQDRDGIIGADDLQAIYQQVGQYHQHAASALVLYANITIHSSLCNFQVSKQI